MPPVPFTHPLPSRPSTGQVPRIPVPAPVTLPPPPQPSPALGGTRNPFFSAPQPASPRPPASPFAQGGSPKLAVGSTGAPSTTSGSPAVAPAHAAALEEPVAWAKKQLDKDELATNAELLPLGEGWVVYWRTWHGPQLVGPLPRPRPPATTSGRSTAGPPAKRAKLTAFDEMLADELAASAAASPTASTSKSVHPALKDQLHALHLTVPAQDPVEKARTRVLELARTTEATSRQFGLFSHVQVVTPPTEDVKGKGKAKEESSPDVARVLWVFSLTKGRPLSSPALDEHEVIARAALNALEFDGLTCQS